MEYMIFGKPIISFSLKETIYTLGDVGIFVPSNDNEQFALKIIEIIKNEELRLQIGFRAQKRVNRFSWNEVSKPLLDAYQKLSIPINI